MSNISKTRNNYRGIRKVNKVLKCIFSVNKESIQKIYMYGSYVYGKPNKESDIDICVIIDNDISRIDLKVEIGNKLFLERILYCDLIIRDSYNFYKGVENNKDGIESTIVKKGRLLYERI